MRTSPGTAHIGSLRQVESGKGATHHGLRAVRQRHRSGISSTIHSAPPTSVCTANSRLLASIEHNTTSRVCSLSFLLSAARARTHPIARARTHALEALELLQHALSHAVHVVVQQRREHLPADRDHPPPVRLARRVHDAAVDEQLEERHALRQGHRAPALRGKAGCSPSDGVRASTFIEPFSLTPDRVPSRSLWSSARMLPSALTKRSTISLRKRTLF
ncbi:hypothetical protein HETIRDRAFT_108799 [Heterobasidion irregulare TC 32-1]|uniref:Uncharacterized protein n=1 Tax=Heterobasidion irregulare (strain TC 32-1) TaxID=747525 RepID=W4KBS4_HETIT|nr:uncharacterized protein HETIRDRAFT_108799 [Heterobasidion irregulare TC 32-1]ETW82526.1 hypothetical protein HETIRDRAFT_108799 [Heterobasidion irregulare TC 32-1]